MTQQAPHTAAILIIGNEILSGRTRDANVQFLATRLAEMGIRLREVRVVRDEEEAIVAAVNALRASHDYLFTTGGIGPTHDDITSASVAKAFAVPVRRSPEAEARLRRHYREEDLNAARLRMAEIPEGAELIENPISQAPGFRIANVFVLAGVPSIMQAMFDGAKPMLAGGPPVRMRGLPLYGPEGLIAAGLADLQGRHPTVEVGSYPFFRQNRLGTVIVARGTEDAALAAAIADVRTLAEGLGVEVGDEERPQDDPVV